MQYDNISYNDGINGWSSIIATSPYLHQCWKDIFSVHAFGIIIVLSYIYLLSAIYLLFYFRACVCVCTQMCVRVGDTAMNLFTFAFRNVLRNLEQNTGNTVIHVFIFTSLTYLLLLKLINGSIFISEEFNSMIYFTVLICFTFFGM